MCGQKMMFVLQKIVKMVLCFPAWCVLLSNNYSINTHMLAVDP